MVAAVGDARLNTQLLTITQPQSNLRLLVLLGGLVSIPCMAMGAA
jgi:hypothetical protein